MDELADLTSLQALRSDLDRRELDLIDRARHVGATWAEIAAALGLASRQAAEQRRQRLRSAVSSRRHDQDLAYAESIAAVRTAVLDLHRHIEADRGWDARFVRAVLTRRTLAIAADAEPGGLFSLAAQALSDVGGAELPRPLRAAVSALRRAVRAAVPGP